MRLIWVLVAIFLVAGCSDPCKGKVDGLEAKYDQDSAVSHVREEEQGRATQYREFVEGEMYSIVTQWQEEEISAAQGMKELEKLLKKSDEWRRD